MWSNIKVRVYGGVGILLIIIIYLKVTSLITMAEAINLILLVGLVAVTAIYARQTGEIARETKVQAEASIRMAKEIENQRYGAVRPVLDILMKPLTPLEHAKIGYSEIEEVKLPEYIKCVFVNIGIGPAIDIWHFAIYETNKIRQELGVLKINDTSIEVYLSLDNRDNDSYLVVNYSDMYGRNFESTREVILPANKKMYTVGPLKTTRIRESDNIND